MNRRGFLGTLAAVVTGAKAPAVERTEPAGEVVLKCKKWPVTVRIPAELIRTPASLGVDEINMLLDRELLDIALKEMHL